MVIARFQTDELRIDLVGLQYGTTLNYDVQVHITHPVHGKAVMWTSKAFHGRRAAEDYFHDAIVSYCMEGAVELVLEIMRGAEEVAV